ncbi:MAG TPA: hypothetical protein PKK06_01890 [Phycisphaerae bacterium]|nr:hypothetical protein [Phycisphaerae bacterium]HNU44124.1 hypothetical protein [Phycisphaerae bacterium]
MKRNVLLGALAGLLACGGCGIITFNPEGPREITEPCCLDTWSVVHMSTGALMGEALGDTSIKPTIFALAAYEIIEPYFWFEYGESLTNAECDILVALLGWFAATADQR